MATRPHDDHGGDGHDDQVKEKDLRAQGKGITIGFLLLPV
jgi:hypothetical protein